MKNKHIFHVHTYRCGHAGKEKDFEYVEKAIELGAEKISFTDHAPFPNNPFGNRMKFDDLPEYFQSIIALRSLYPQIEIELGLEIEYLPSYDYYYQFLLNNNSLDYLVLGQHFYEEESGKYSFSNTTKYNEYIGLSKAIVEGINTGYFLYVAHPDRIYRYENKWNQQLENSANEIVKATSKQHVILEKNVSSMKKQNYYRKEFWSIANGRVDTIYGLDAHSTQELRRQICMY